MTHAIYCPRCTSELVHADGDELLGCRRCRGCFAALGGAALRGLHGADAPAALWCPCCATPMRRCTVLERALHVDFCAAHGIWFDAGAAEPARGLVALMRYLLLWLDVKPGR